MIAKIVLGLSLSCLLASLGFLALTDRTQAQPNPSTLVPKEPIVMWSGDPSMIPEGWQLCDGTNGTPNLHDRFILGTKTNEAPGETGGSHMIQLSVDNLPAHSHYYKTNYAGDHWHSFSDSLNQSYTQSLGGLITYGNIADWTMVEVTRTTEGVGDHCHGGHTSNTGYNIPWSFDTRPAYYSLAFITRR